MYIADGKFLLHFPTLFQILKLPISFIRAWSVYSLESTAVDSKGHILSNTVVPDIPEGLETNRICGRILPEFGLHEINFRTAAAVTRPVLWLCIVDNDFDYRTIDRA